MRLAAFLLGILTLLAPADADAQDGASTRAGEPSGPLAMVIEVSGEARLALQTDTSVAAALTPLFPRTGLLTGPDGRVALAFADPLRLRVEPGTAAGFAGQYDAAGYVSREVRLDSGRVTFAFPPLADSTTVPLTFFSRAQGSGSASVSSGSGGVLVDSSSLRIVVTEGEAELNNESSGERLSVPAGSVGVLEGDGLSVRPSTLAERDLVAEPVARRRRLLVPGTDDEGNARTFIIEWDE